jgi:seryl-tRNA synthetase
MKATLLLRTAFSLFAVMALSSCFDSGGDTAEEDPEEAAYQAEKGERDKIKARVAELRAEKKELETSIKEMKSAASKQDELAKKEVEIMSDLEAARQYVASVDTLTTQVDASLAAWREATRTSFKGVQLPEITTVDGKTYTAVTINGVTDESLIVEHSGGMETIPVMQLPVSLRKNIIHESTVLAEQGL